MLQVAAEVLKLASDAFRLVLRADLDDELLGLLGHQVHGISVVAYPPAEGDNPLGVLRLPLPMLARSGSIPERGRWPFEVKWDGFRALVRTDGDFAVRSRRGWSMTEFVPELAELPACGVRRRARQF